MPLPTMSLTTLVTFFLKTERDVVSVDLLGSWDSFKKVYSMERDPKLGRGHWRGCHSITDIICDGDSVSSPDSKRDGGLLEGGTYWYYYRLNDETEIHDLSWPSTTACPFLPGQQVNVLEVPMQLTADGEQPDSDPTPAGTLSPGDRFSMLKPQAAEESLTPTHRKPSADFASRPRTPGSKYGHDTAKTSAEVVNPFIRGHISNSDVEVRAQTAHPAELHFWNLEENLRPYSTGTMPDHWDPTDFSYILVELAQIEEHNIEHRPRAQMSHTRRLSLALNRLSLGDVLGGADLQREEPAPTLTRSKEESFKLGSATTVESMEAAERTRSGIMLPATQPSSEGRAARHSTCGLQHSFSVSSNRTSAFFSSITSDSEIEDVGMCPQQSQPRTPTRSEFGDVMLTTTWATPEHHRTFAPAARLENGSMKVYSLPEAETASALTLQNLETATVKSVNGDSPALETGTRHRFVEAWNDGNGHRRTGLQELVDEMGYLGSLIG